MGPLSCVTSLLTAETCFFPGERCGTVVIRNHSADLDFPPWKPLAGSRKGDWGREEGRKNHGVTEQCDLFLFVLLFLMTF